MSVPEPTFRPKIWFFIVAISCAGTAGIFPVDYGLRQKRKASAHRTAKPRQTIKPPTKAIDSIPVNSPYSSGQGATITAQFAFVPKRSSIER